MPEPITGEQGGPADTDRQITEKIESDYRDLLKRQQEAEEAKRQGEATLQFDSVRKLGFATKKDYEEYVQGIFGKFAAENEAMRKEIDKLREWVMRAKAQGLNTGALDQSQKEPNILDKFKPAFRGEDWKK